MKLTDLEPIWLNTWASPDGKEKGWQQLDPHDGAKATGLMFHCPKCYIEKGNTLIGVHQVICWSSSRGTPADITPLPGRWKIEGEFANLTLNSEHGPQGARSIQLGGGCNAHFFITNGEVQMS